MSLRSRRIELSAARNYVMPELSRKPLTAIMLGDVDFMLMASGFGNLAAFRPFLATFSLRMLRAAIYMSFR